MDRAGLDFLEEMEMKMARMVAFHFRHATPWSVRVVLSVLEQIVLRFPFSIVRVVRRPSFRYGGNVLCSEGSQPWRKG